MSRLAKKPLMLAANVQAKKEGNAITLKGPKGELKMMLHDSVDVVVEANQLQVKAKSQPKGLRGVLGTTWVLLKNMLLGVTVGFEKKLSLVGVGYRAKLSGKTLEMTLGFSHPIVYAIPEGIVVEVPTQTDIIVKGKDKAQVGQVAADIMAYRPVESYKGKGVRYADQRVLLKEAKKKSK